MNWTTIIGCRLLVPLAITTGMTISVAPVGLAQVDNSIPAPTQAVNRLKPGDRIRLSVTGFPEFASEQIVLADGTLQLPLAGSIAIAGLTPAEAVTTITTALLPYIRRPQVGLAVVNIRPPRISVAGEVLRPGPRLLVPPEEYQNPNAPPNTGGENFQTVSYALLVAGGITPNADIRNITIRRAEPGAANKNQNGKTEIKVDLWQAIQTGDLSADPQVLDGDEIIVPIATVTSAEQQQLLASTIAPRQIRVQVGGQVQRPGPVEVAPTSGVSAAVAAAGGPTDKAKKNAIELLRMNPDGKLERKTFALGEDSGPLREGDVVLVSKSPINTVLDYLGTFLNPIAPILFLLR